MLTVIDGRGSIIVTSRHTGAERLGKPIHVPSMIDNGGVELLLRDLPADEIEKNETEAHNIVQRLGGLALAIDQAAAYIKFRRIPLSKFMSAYEEEKARILKYTDEELWEYKKSTTPAAKMRALSVFTTLEMSLDQIELENPERKQQIARFLAVSAYLDHRTSVIFSLTSIAEKPEIQFHGLPYSALLTSCPIRTRPTR